MKRRIETKPSDRELLLAYLDGGLPPTETEAIEGRLKAEPGLAEALIVLSRDEIIISEWSATTVLDPLQPYASIGLSWRRFVPWFTTAALLLATGIGLYFALRSAPSTSIPLDEAVRDSSEAGDVKALGPIVARMEEVHGEAFLVSASGQSGPLITGQDIHAGEQVRTGDGGVAVVHLPDSTRLELGTDTLLRVLSQTEQTLYSSSEFFLSSGMLHADVPAHPQGKSVIFSTPQATFKADGTRFSSAARGEVTSVEIESGAVKMTMTTGGEVVDVREGRYVLAGSKHGSVRNNALPPRVTTFRETIPGGAGPTLGVAASPVGPLAAINAWHGNVYLHDLVTGRTFPSLTGQERHSRDVHFSKDGKLLACGAEDKNVKFRVWDALTGTELITTRKLKTTVNALDFSPDGKCLVTGGGPVKGEAEVFVWDLETATPLAALPGHSHTVSGVAYRPQGDVIATICRDGLLRIWNAKTFEMLGAYAAHSGEGPVLAFAPDGKTLATGGRDGLVKLWDTETWTVRATLDGHLREVGALAFSPDSKYLASAGLMTTIWLWDVAKAEPVRSYIGHKFKVTGVAFSADGRTLLTSGWDRTVKLWDVEP